ncbi:MAG: hypothetical protein WD696_16465 [Bryobacteraceae bacterium]
MPNKKLPLILLAALALSGCGATKIGRIKADPSRYHNRNVKVEGTVTRSVGAIVAGLYEVEDETGKIYVLSNRGVPSKGSRVGVSGTVTSGVTVGSRSFGTAIRERDHKVR